MPRPRAAALLCQALGVAAFSFTATVDHRLEAAFAPYVPFRSVASWYMWRVCETPSFMEK